MNTFKKTDRWIEVLSSAALAGFLLTAGGCVVHDDGYRVERVERRPIARADYSNAPPVPAAESPADDDALDDVYEPAPAEAVTAYEPELNPHGDWVVTADYGRCWVPRGRPAGWRPYTVGHWVNTDAGWCWTAEGPEADWGVVTYHYGRWYEDPRHGWCWVPGTTWAPAWVAWRDGGGYCGWAPLPPRVGARQEIRAAYVERRIPADRYVYVEHRYLAEPHVRQHVVVNNVTVIKKTTNITNITYVNNRVVNRGVSVTEVERSSGRRYQPVRTTEVSSLSEARRLRSEGKEVAYEPAAVKKADVEYRQRVQRRVEDQKAERARVARRAEDAKDAEHERGAAREKAAAAAKTAEHDRVVARQKEQAAADQAEHERAMRRAKDAAAADKAEHERAVRRAKDEADAKTAAQRAKTVKTTPAKDIKSPPRENKPPVKEAKPPVKETRPPAREVKPDPAAAKAAEHERAVRRAKDEADAKAAADAKDAGAKAAEHERAVRRAKEEADAKAAAAKRAKSVRTAPKDDSADQAAAKAAQRERVARRAKEAADAKAKADADAKAAEHERAVRRAQDEADAKAKADADARAKGRK
jgi:hypothetical protein